MNKLKLLEAMNMIDDDLVKEAQMLSDTDIEAETTENSEMTASGVEVYHRSGWQRFAAIAAALILSVGLAGTGSYLMKNRRHNVKDINNSESEIIAPVTNNSNSVSTNAESSDVTDKKANTVTSDKNKVTTSQTSDKKTTTTGTNTVKSTDSTGSASSAGGNSRIGTNTSNAKHSTNTTTKMNSGKTTTTTSGPTDPPPPPIIATPADGKMTMQELLDFHKYYNKTLTWNDLAPYMHEESVSEKRIWKIPVFDGGKQAFTMLVSGSASSSDKKHPSDMLLYRGTETNHQDYIDFHNDSITMFTYPQYIFRGELGVLDFFDPYYVQSAQITGIISNHQDHVYLTDSEIADLIELFRNIEIIKPEGDAWMQNRNAYYDISVSDIYNYDHNFRIQYPYIIIDGTGYSAQESGLSALYDFASSVFSNYQNISANVDVSGAWCWHEFNSSDINESIIIKQFPELIFHWYGTKNIIDIYNTDTGDITTTTAQFNALFADINGDGYPELCTTNDRGMNRAVIIDADFFDIHNNKHYSLSSPDEYNYWLYEENGSLFVNRTSSNEYVPYDRERGDKGTVRFNGDNAVFIPCE